MINIKLINKTSLISASHIRLVNANKSEEVIKVNN